MLYKTKKILYLLTWIVNLIENFFQIHYGDQILPKYEYAVILFNRFPVAESSSDACCELYLVMFSSFFFFKHALFIIVSGINNFSIYFYKLD